ncbi:hypothetical protein LWI28_006193 [Acer negundo]|uniref:Uncharacterized protein n=1 Tax=Acer negundo TaxID=4023 RepID=A0AAD5NT53_ACENE|nr:hypothetical protein LWI28_006193 [Acer negundo]
MRWLMLWMSVLVRTTSYQSLLLQDPDEVGHDVWNLIKPFLENLKMSWKTEPCDPSSGLLMLISTLQGALISFRRIKSCFFINIVGDNHGLATTETHCDFMLMASKGLVEMG